MGLGFKRFCFKSDVLSEGLLSGLGFKRRMVKWLWFKRRFGKWLAFKRRFVKWL